EEPGHGVVDLVAVEELPHRPWPERLPPGQLGVVRRGERDLDDRAAQRLPVGERLHDGQGADQPPCRDRDHPPGLVREQPGELDDRPEAQRPRGERELQPHPRGASDRTCVLDPEHRVLLAQPPYLLGPRGPCRGHVLHARQATRTRRPGWPPPRAGRYQPRPRRSATPCPPPWGSGPARRSAPRPAGTARGPPSRRRSPGARRRPPGPRPGCPRRRPGPPRTGLPAGMRRGRGPGWAPGP